MTTIAETSDTVANALDDIADTAIGVSGWSDGGDSSVTNDGASNSWDDNARLLQHDSTGHYILFYIAVSDYWSNNNTSYEYSGIRILHCEDWNFTESRPSGKTNYYSDSIDSTDLDSLTNSYTETAGDNTNGGCGLHYTTGSNCSADRSDTVTYFGSVASDHLTIAMWAESDSDINHSNGGASGSYWSFLEPTKFWNDNVTPSFAWVCLNLDNSGSNQDHYNAYSWEVYSNSDQSTKWVGDYYGCVGRSEWGFPALHPDSDEFIYRFAQIFRASDQNIPVAPFDSVAPNNDKHGLAHGSEVTLDGTTYRAVNWEPPRDGNYTPGRGNAILSALLRYE